MDHPFTVEGQLLTDVGGTLSTPGMIGTGPTMLVAFEVEVNEGERTSGVGTHERRIVSRG